VSWRSERGGQLEEMGPRDGGVVGEGAEEPGRSERAPIASGGGMRRSEEAGVSEEAVRRKGARRSEKAKVPEEG